jgi:hypothetical protein
MALMKNATGNVYKIVMPNKVDDFLRKGFIICEESGGDAIVSPSAPLQNEEVKEEPKIEAPVIVEEKGNALMYNGRYWNQLNKTEFHAICDREGVAYDEADTVPMLRSKFGNYAKSVKKK